MSQRAKRSPKEQAFRDQLVPRDQFACACGCELQLSRGDLLDATLVAARLGGSPRTAGVTLTKIFQPLGGRVDLPEPTVGRPCSKCGDIVELPEYAAKLLDDRKCFWPLCSDCRKPASQQQPARDARSYWE